MVGILHGMLVVFILFVLGFNNSVAIQWCYNTANIPGAGALWCTLPVAYKTNKYSVVGTMSQNGSHNSRLFVADRQITGFNLDWTDSTYVDRCTWISVGF